MNPRGATGKNRIILHVDMDQFYAAVEEREHPELEGKPVVVGADPKEGQGRGVVSTSNYEARNCGVYSGMPISRAWKLCPRAVYLQPNYELYTETSSRIMTILRSYADKFEQWGLDEAFLDVSSKVESYERARDLARVIKREVSRKERLTCSIGVGPNKLVAKIASDFKKPDGLTVVPEEKAENFLAPLPVRRLLWVGRKTERKLNRMGIETIGDLASHDVATLTEKFGVAGVQYHLSALGRDSSEVSESRETKSVSREVTFEIDTSDRTLVLDTLRNLGFEIHAKVVQQKLLFKTITVKIRYQNFETRMHGKTLSFFTNALPSLQRIAQELAERNLHVNRKVRLIGLKVSSLSASNEQKTLFESEL